MTKMDRTPLQLAMERADIGAKAANGILAGALDEERQGTTRDAFDGLAITMSVMNDALMACDHERRVEVSLGKKVAWKAVASKARQLVTAIREIRAELVARREVEKVSLRNVAKRKADFGPSAEPSAPKKARKNAAESNPITYELLRKADSAEGLRIGPEAKERGVTFETIECPLANYARRNPAGLVGVKGYEGSQRRIIFTARAWAKHHAAAHADATTTPWPVSSSPKRSAMAGDPPATFEMPKEG